MDIIELFNNRLELKSENTTENWYQCPLCSSGTIKLNKTNGKYKNWNCNCNTKQITKLVFRGSGYTKKETIAKIPEIIKEIPNIPNVKLSFIANPESLLHLETIYSNPNARIVYSYSNTQQTLRVNKIKKTGKKALFPQILTNEGWVNGKGSDIFPLYTNWRILKGELIVVVEGEKCVDYLQAKGIESASVLNLYTTSIENIKLSIEISKDYIVNVTQILYVPDLDEVGMKKAILFQKASWSLGIPTKIFDIREKLLKPIGKGINFDRGYDIADYIAENKDVNLVSIFEDEFRQRE